MKKILLLIAIIFLLNGCAALTENFIATNCNTNAAFAAGVNDAKNNSDMNSNFAAVCPVNTAQINAAYRSGYQFGFSNNNAPGININVSGGGYVPNRWMCAGFGNQTCGYDCKTAFGETKCAQYPGQQCVVDNFGKIACGYDCVKSINGVKCAHYAGDNCVKDNFGEMKCGANCRMDFGQIKCDRYR